MIGLEQYRSSVGQFNAKYVKAGAKNEGSLYNLDYIKFLVLNILLPMLPLLCYSYDEGFYSKEAIGDGLMFSFQTVQWGVRMAWQNIMPGFVIQNSLSTYLKFAILVVIGKTAHPRVALWPNWWLVGQITVSVLKCIQNICNHEGCSWENVAMILVEANSHWGNIFITSKQAIFQLLQDVSLTTGSSCICMAALLGYWIYKKNAFTFEKIVKMVLVTLISICYIYALGLIFPSAAFKNCIQITWLQKRIKKGIMMATHPHQEKWLSIEMVSNLDQTNLKFAGLLVLVGLFSAAVCYSKPFPAMVCNRMDTKRTPKPPSRKNNSHSP